ncbi:HAD domain-containing protein [Sphingosinicella sp. BN140058]|uniref:HAD domain-containing protein n=1 Tax=Sphingosinicella sp. BN140058 TaxID=1892855 RepID=UPI001011DE99|nr:HAD domain-containing protein [Sphingosinicella sp. BN140058]QAY80329.1 hypothetical protein ETR14_27180 [Sphingosinicella sp. BN140058]
MIVYLDIDGVIIPKGSDPNVISPDFAARLTRILDATGARIVVSSHRRRSPHAVRALLTASGVARDRFAADPFTALVLPDLDDDLSIRGQEIARHVQRNNVEAYVILDDCPCLPSQASLHVQTDDRRGLSDVDADVAINILRPIFS